MSWFSLDQEGFHVNILCYLFSAPVHSCLLSFIVKVFEDLVPTLVGNTSISSTGIRAGAS